MKVLYQDVYEEISKMQTDAYNDTAKQSNEINGLHVEISSEGAIYVGNMGAMTITEASEYISTHKPIVNDPLKESDVLVPIAKHIAQQFVTRASSQALKGKKRDSMALEFVLGAASAMQVTGQSSNMNALLLLASMVSIRGYRELDNWANR